MKPPPFTYHDPQTQSEAVALLGRLENAKLLAGGQSLMAMMNMRYVLPDHLIDLNKVEGLSGIAAEGETLRIGAMTRQRDLEFSDTVSRGCPLMAEALLQVGHRQTRNRGTIGGSLCHLDPSAELPTVAMAMDATVHVAGPNGMRDVAMRDFPLAYMTPAVEPDEMVTAVTLPLWAAGHGSAFVEFARRHGDFAIASAAVLLEVDAAGTIRRAALALGGMGEGPVRVPDAEAALVGSRGSQAFADAAASATKIDAMADVHASVAYRQHLAGVMARRALEKALARATGGGHA